MKEIYYFCSMKILTSAQIHELDNYTIKQENIKSIDLMERAATCITDSITRRWGPETPFVVFAGPGNNGGDALAVARMLADKHYSVEVFLFNINARLSDDCKTNCERLHQNKHVKSFVEVKQEFNPPTLSAKNVVIDGLFGSGINKPLSGGFAALVKYINASMAHVVSIDMPSGLMTEENTFNVRQNIINADLTLTLGSKKVCMLLADNQPHLGEVEVLDIGLAKDFKSSTKERFSMTDINDVRAMVKPRNAFAHKGTMGHALIIAGSYGMAGAAILATKACLRSGVGKVTIHTPKSNRQIMQIAVPEAIVQLDKEETIFSQAVDTDAYQAACVGPGIGLNETSAIALVSQVRSNKTPMVLDADALNLLGAHRAWMKQLSEGLIFTPHPKELERLVGTSAADDYERLMQASELAQTIRGYVMLKGHHSALCCPDGNIIFNSTGNAGMATAGSGDVLSGIITALLARGYERQEAAVLGMYLHGLAGDIAAEEYGQESLTASDIIDALPKAFKSLYK